MTPTWYFVDRLNNVVVPWTHGRATHSRQHLGEDTLVLCEKRNNAKRSDGGVAVAPVALHARIHLEERDVVLVLRLIRR